MAWPSSYWLQLPPLMLRCYPHNACIFDKLSRILFMWNGQWFLSGFDHIQWSTRTVPLVISLESSLILKTLFILNPSIMLQQKHPRRPRQQHQIHCSQLISIEIGSIGVHRIHKLGNLSKIFLHCLCSLLLSILLELEDLIKWLDDPLLNVVDPDSIHGPLYWIRRKQLMFGIRKCIV